MRGICEPPYIYTANHFTLARARGVGVLDDALRGSASKQSQQTINSADARACGVKFSFCEIPLNYTFLVSWAAIQFFKNSFVVMRIAVR